MTSLKCWTWCAGVPALARSVRLDRGAAFVLVAALGFSGPLQSANAQSAKKAASGGSLEGSWSGGGTILFATGVKEQARCRVHYSRASTNSYAVNATCATASGKAAQTARVRQVSTNNFSGSFYNREYSISGVMHVSVRGTSQTMQLISDSASGVINLSR
jgi:hypothetical protein